MEIKTYEEVYKKDIQSSDFVISLSYQTKRIKPLKGYLDGIIAELAAGGKSYVDIYE